MDEYCVKYVRLSSYGIIDERFIENIDLSDIEEESVRDGKNCVYTKVESRNVLVCSDGEEFVVAYRIKC